jgi:hypothetical protein
MISLPKPTIIISEHRDPFFATDAEIEAWLSYERSFNYVRELKGKPNCGPEIEVFQRFTFNEPGASWCCSFQCWCLFGVWPNIPLRKTGSCQQLRERAKTLGWLLPIGSSPQKGDIGLVIDESAATRAKLGRDHAHHIFAVSSQWRGGLQSFDSIEGNTNPAGGREGYGVFERDDLRAMKKSTTYQFIRIPRKAAA